ncbi:sigma-54-dependent transcriptional regulator [Chitinilyticum litopenaei]|uniref:sigma-54-dependent transcriptional regulator n=1 Tax=Chitinilyticum litopenaei TaxID=1121276 RepID=UPI000491FD13|nr:sigma-54 dependent transcriptional regulator [Chitinilyticum litopenaei]
MQKRTRNERRILVVDDERDLADLLELTLIKMGLAVDKAYGVEGARELVAANHYDLCLTDMRMQDGDGLDVLRAVQASGHDTPVAVITAYGSTDNAVTALKHGAFDYLAKPVALEQLRTLVRSALKLDAAASEAAPEAAGDSLLVGVSPPMQQVRQLIDKLARNQAPVYITGESGSGKERAARMIHARSSRADKPFVAVNCGAIPENLMESEFFGYRKGAFTGANEDRSGFFQAAHGGTLFLDEVADLPLAMQVKLLRAIQERKVRKVGATQEEEVDVRIISATHQNLARCVEAGKFRQDLYYRLNVIEVRMPSLRELGDDILTIARHVLARIAERNGSALPELTPTAAEAMRSYGFPGNVRELENVLERALALSDGTQIGADDLQLTVSDEPEHGGSGLAGCFPLQDYLDRTEKAAILQALGQTGGNRTQAAKILGVTFRSLRYRMERLGMS